MKSKYQYEAVITNVVDGDTVDALVDLGFGISSKMRIRIYGIDTKEINSKYTEEREMAMKAKTFVTLFLLNRKVLLTTYKPDKYGRYLAEITFILDGIERNIGNMLLIEDLAEPYYGGTKE